MRTILTSIAMMLTAVVAIAKDIKTVVVTITYDADKTSSEKIIQSFGKFGYKATEVKNEKKAETKKAQTKKLGK